MANNGSFFTIPQIVQYVSPALADTIFVHAQTDERETFASIMGALTETLKFRPFIWKTWAKNRQREWLWTNLRQPRFAAAALQLFQEWFFTQRTPMLNQFLDALGIAHNEEGLIQEDLPETLDETKVRESVEGLLKAFPAEETALYLHLFQHGRKDGWASLGSLLANDPRLKLGS
jgi:hypothetical protein